MPDTKAKQALRKCLSKLGLPPGLLSTVYDNYVSCDSRLWLLDNSARMKTRDAHVGRGEGHTQNSYSNDDAPMKVERVDDVTRWEELQECVAFHTKMAAQCRIPSKYWLVNDPAKSYQNHARSFSLCWGDDCDVSSELNQIRNVMQNITLDQSACPLTYQLKDLGKRLAKEASNVEARDKHVTLVICTQGLLTYEDGEQGTQVFQEFEQELAKISKLPVRIIVRLTTDNEKVRDVFNTMDAKFSVDVLDDYWGEANEVYLHNPWLTYTIGLHRLRESGLAPEVMDNLDEEPLSLDEIHELCKMIFLGDDDLINLPHPKGNWDNFICTLKILVEKEEKQWNPVKKRLMPWIDLEKLQAMHGGGRNSQYFNVHGNRSFRRKKEQQEQRSTYSDPSESSQKNTPPPQHHRHTSFHPPPKSPPKQSDRRQSFYTPPPPFRSNANSSLTLTEVLKRWSHQPPDYKRPHSLQRILVTVPETFPPTNTKVEHHDYFEKWKTFDKEAFEDESGDGLKELLKRAVRKAKFFLHPDKLPNYLTENQSEVFKTVWNVIRDGEANWLS